MYTRASGGNELRVQLSTFRQHGGEEARAPESPPPPVRRTSRRYSNVLGTSEKSMPLTLLPAPRVIDSRLVVSRQ